MSQTKPGHISTKQLARTENAKVIVVDDNIDLLKLISIRLKPLKFDLKLVTSAEEALSVLSLWPADLVITDLQMSGMSGMELFDQLHARDPLLPVIILTAHGTIPDAVEAAQSGVTAYLTKPFDSDALVEQIQIALLSSGFSSSNPSDNNALVQNHQWRSNIISKSPLIEALLHQIEILAEGTALIAFEGEPGTGKDELARATHARSDRAKKPLVHLSCTSIPEDLLDIEMFGRAGDGTADNPPRSGILQQAHQGTLIFSDFSEAPSRLLHKMMQALIQKKARPVDSDEFYEVDVRAITTTASIDQYAAPSYELWDLATELDVTMLSVPPLRERREDIPLIINHTLKNFVENSDIQFSNKAMQQLLIADWPGNVRHVMNVVKQCARLTKTKIISEALVKSRILNPAFQIQPLTNAHREFERKYLTEILIVTNGNVTKAANMAKRNRTEFHRLLKKHKIEAQSFRH